MKSLVARRARDAGRAWAFLATVSLTIAAGSAGAGIEEGAEAARRGDYAVAFLEFREAATQGNAEAQYRLAVLYVQGRGVARSALDAEMWMRKAAEQNHPAAQTGLGYMYLLGLGVARDDEMALHWYRKAADLGDGAAQYGLGVLYAQGRGVDMDQAEALKWYRKAAEQGNARALEALKRLGQH